MARSRLKPLSALQHSLLFSQEVSSSQVPAVVAVSAVSVSVSSKKVRATSSLPKLASSTVSRSRLSIVLPASRRSRRMPRSSFQMTYSALRNGNVLLSATRMWLHSSRSTRWLSQLASTCTSSQVLMHRSRFLHSISTTIRTSTSHSSAILTSQHGRSSASSLSSVITLSLQYVLTLWPTIQTRVTSSLLTCVSLLLHLSQKTRVLASWMLTQVSHHLTSSASSQAIR